MSIQFKYTWLSGNNLLTELSFGQVQEIVDDRCRMADRSTHLVVTGKYEGKLDLVGKQTGTLETRGKGRHTGEIRRRSRKSTKRTRLDNEGRRGVYFNGAADEGDSWQVRAREDDGKRSAEVTGGIVTGITMVNV